MANNKHVVEYTDVINGFSKVKDKIDNLEISANQITSGIIDIDRLPKNALERLVYVTDDEARFKLTTQTVQNGDTVKVNSTGNMYFIVDENNLDSESGYEPYTSSIASAVAWEGITNKPQTYTPSAHSHSIADVTNLANTLNNLRTDIDRKPDEDTNTKYKLSQEGHKITLTDSEGVTSSVTTVDTDTNTTYTLTQDANDGHKLTFKASDGTTTNITIPDNDTKYDLNTMINGLGTADSTPTDSNYLVSQSGTDTGYKRTPFSKILDYLKSKFSYNDLKDKPTIGNGTVTIKQNGTEKASFSMNQTGNATVELTDTNTNTWRDVVDGLDSTRTDASLSANQGKVLNDKIDAIQIGGRNLLLETKDFSVGTSNVTGIFDLTNKIGAFTVLKAKCPSDRSYYDPFSQKLEFEPNTQYTLSFYAKADSTCIVGSFFYNIGNEGTYKDGFTQTAIGSKWKKYVITWTTGDTARLASVIPIRLQDTKDVWVYMYAVKFEKGNKATDWTPAPEDVEADATTKANNALDSAKSYTDTQVSPINTSVSKLQSQLGSHTVNSDVPANAKFTDTNTWRGIQDNLTSTLTSDSLSANQGRILKGLIDGKADTGHKQAYTASECVSYTSDDNTMGVTPAAVKKAIGLFEPKAHTHDYLPLAGGTMSGDITFAKIGTSTIGNGDKDYAGLNAKNNLNIASWWGVSFTTSCIGGSAYVDKPAVSIDCRNGTLAAADKIYANGGFVGDLTGNAATATNASKVNNHTVNADVPSGAKFTDTNTWRPVETVLNTEDLNAITTPGFYSAGGNNTVTNKPSGVAHFGMYVVHRANGSYYTQILLSDDKSYRRHCENGTWGAWKEDKLTDNNTTYGTANASTSGLTKLYTSTGTATDGTMTQDAIKSALDGKANSSHTHTKSQITDFPSSMPASDVYSWAKASSKPSYNWSEINNKPTIPTNTNQLTNGAGFITGITKEMVTGALGYTPPSTDTNTWRPLGTTADTACAGNDSRLSNARPASDVYSWAKASSKPSYTWSEIGNTPTVPKMYTATPTKTNWTINSTDYNCVVYQIGNMGFAMVAIEGTIYSRQWLPAAKLPSAYAPKKNSSVMICGVSGSDHMECMVTTDGYIKVWWSGSSSATTANICIPYYMA